MIYVIEKWVLPMRYLLREAKNTVLCPDSWTCTVWEFSQAIIVILKIGEGPHIHVYKTSYFFLEWGCQKYC